MWCVALASLLLMSSVSKRSLAFADDDIDPYDFSWINKWAAIGDSYAAGIGAGNVLQSSCSRYDGAYPNLVNLQLGTDPESIDFTFGACSGALTTDIIKQANKLSSGQQMITISSGGNDAGLSKVLNNCVFTWWSTQTCADALNDAQAAMENDEFSTNLDTLISTAKSKLADNGTIYYTGYAKFFDTSSNDCDTVSWAVWARKASWQYLTQLSRQRMNDLVDMMNAKLQAAVDRAGDQVVFVNYDSYLDTISGRFCMPGIDESAGKGSQREYLFFYEMKTTDIAMLIPGQDPPKTELRRRADVVPANDTLGATISAWMEDMLQTYPDADLEDENANSDLEDEVLEEKQELQRKLKAREARKFSPRGISRSEVLRMGWNITSNEIASSATGAVLSTSTAILIGGNLTLNTTSLNSTLVLVEGNSTTNITSLNSTSSNSKMKAISFFVPDSVTRVFHPQQGGHSLIANLIMWHMASKQDFLAMGPENSTLASLGSACILPPSPTCNGSSTDTWTTRDSAASAIASFCSIGSNLNGTAGQTTSGTYNNGTTNFVEISIEWEDADTIDDGSCNTYFLTLLDSCDVPNAGSANLKHGGSIDYQGNATLSIKPLVMQREWYGGQPTYHTCIGGSTYYYLEQSILASNIQDYCTKSAQNNIAANDYEFSQDYQAGTPDAVTISTSWPAGDLSYEIFEEECNYYLGTVMNGCDVPSSDSNPMNWKHGGQMSDNNQVTYTINPTTLRPSAPDSPQAECTFKVSWFRDVFTVTGGGFADADNGSELKKQLSGCGALTGWSFSYFGSPDGSYEWKAAGNLPQTMKAGCIERAVQSAGGPTTKNLHCS